MKTLTTNNKHVFDNYEISPCWQLGNGGESYTEVCEEADAQFWTLYGHITGEGVQAIGDFNSREAAEEVFYRITGLAFTGSYEADERLRLMHATPQFLELARQIVLARDTGESVPIGIYHAAIRLIDQTTGI